MGNEPTSCLPPLRLPSSFSNDPIPLFDLRCEREHQHEIPCIVITGSGRAQLVIMGGSGRVWFHRGGGL
jgi:hypothetical protein